ncbi:hypothetical protein HF086_012827 [Spodoptera exigua]|uniref:KH type-2 domain-containing protein n=1 Tax=Spodoptera exigua TaxID=7107 RepID=A0A922MM46_SPOEX|nr:hypothetical protein HF086_012827 [Spodoptera exigua]
MAVNNISKKRKFVGDGVFKAELNEFLTRELAEDGYSGVEVRVTPTRSEIIIMATRTQSVLGEKGRRIRELTSVVQKRFNIPEQSVELYAEKVATRGLCAIAQAESLRYKLIGGLAVRRACYGVLRFIMESGARGCEVKIMLPWDQQGKNGPKKPQPDHILVTEPKDEPVPLEPTSDVRSLAPAPLPQPVAAVA